MNNQEKNAYISRNQKAFKDNGLTISKVGTDRFYKLSFILLVIMIATIATAWYYLINDNKFKSEIFCGNTTLSCESQSCNCPVQKCPVSVCEVDCVFPSNLSFTIFTEENEEWEFIKL